MKGQSLSRIVLFGAYGQLGSDFLDLTQGQDWEVVCAPRDLRLDDCEAIGVFVRECKPQWVINAAAMTDVDAAHQDPNRAMRVNGVAPGLLAHAADEVGARVVHISSEAVYEGTCEVPYVEEDACRPVSVYGASKLTGDLLTVTYSPNSFVLRTSWLYSSRRGNNFPTRILDQLSDPSKVLSVVTDIVGNPTPTTLLVDAIVAIVKSPPNPGLYHVCAAGPASKFDWAVEIAKTYGYDPLRLRSVTSDQYKTVAKRPKYVDLDCSKFRATGLVPLPRWQEAWIASRLT